MRKIHTFQKYSQRENLVTNNTLLFLSRLQKYSNSKFQSLINVVLQENNLTLNIGVNFWQQEKGSNSVFDGSISQEEFKISIETKLFDNFSLEQLKNHIQSIAAVSGKNQILLALSKSNASNDIKTQIISSIKTIDAKVKFASTTFSDIIEIARKNTAVFETEINELIDEYYEFCKENGLIKDDSEYLLVFTAGTSLEENLKYGLYYDPVDRNHNTDFSKIGLYSNKAIVAVGDVKDCIWADLENDTIIIHKSDHKVSDETKNRIAEIIRNTGYYDIQSGHKFYMVDEFYRTNFIKRSSGPLRGKMYWKITDLPGCTNKMVAKEIAEKIDGNEWD